jgi:hypothetical protein
VQRVAMRCLVCRFIQLVSPPAGLPSPSSVLFRSVRHMRPGVNGQLSFHWFTEPLVKDVVCSEKVDQPTFRTMPPGEQDVRLAANALGRLLVVQRKGSGGLDDARPVRLPAACATRRSKSELMNARRQ